MIDLKLLYNVREFVNFKCVVGDCGIGRVFSIVVYF